LVVKYARRRACSDRLHGRRYSPKTLTLDLGDVVPSMAGPKRPEGRVALPAVAEGFAARWRANTKRRRCVEALSGREPQFRSRSWRRGESRRSTSCTNTSNPSVLIGAGLLARNAAAKGLTAKPWVKTSLAPGSQVVAEYLAIPDCSSISTRSDSPDRFGCTTCIGNSGPLPEEISKAINDNGIIGAAVLSGNRNFEGRVSPDVQANYLASPPLVLPMRLAGR